MRFRLITQYSIDTRDSLRDDGRTNLPLVVQQGNAFVPAAAYDRRSLQANFLFTYLPNPGTVMYLGYGNLRQRPDLDGRAALGPTRSDFFLKLSYLLKMRG